MDKKNHIEILASDLGVIANRLNGYSKMSEIPQIELDLLLSKIQKIYEEIYQLRKMKDDIISHGQTSDKEKEVQKEKEIQSSVFELVEDPVQVIGPIVEITSDRNIQQEKLTRVDEIKKEREIHEVNISKASTTHSKEIKTKHEPEILADRFTAPPSRHESISQAKVVSDLSSKLQSKPIHDIQHSIGLNEKFLFIKELFAGNSSAYTETIHKLNDAPGFEAAMQYIYNNFTWDMDGETVLKLVDLVRRKHLTDEA